MLFCKQRKSYGLLCCSTLTYLSQQNTFICLSCVNFLAFQFVDTRFLMVMLQTVTQILSRKLLENTVTLSAWPNHHDRRHQLLKLWEFPCTQIGFIQLYLCWHGRESSVCLKKYFKLKFILACYGSTAVLLNYSASTIVTVFSNEFHLFSC